MNEFENEMKENSPIQAGPDGLDLLELFLDSPLQVVQMELTDQPVPESKSPGHNLLVDSFCEV